jgi:hypothetical protein
MKTMTEFNGFQIKGALAKQAELAAAGKTPEEIPAAMGEAYKLEGDKLKFFMNALAHAQAQKHPETIKRVLVMSLAEGEKAPHGAAQVEEHYYLAETYPQPASKQKAHGRGDRDERGRGKGRRGKGRGGRGGERGGRGGERGERGGRGPRPQGEKGAQAGAKNEGKPSGSGASEAPSAPSK